MTLTPSLVAHLSQLPGRKRPVLIAGSERNRRAMTGIWKRGVRRFRHLVGHVPNVRRVF